MDDPRLAALKQAILNAGWTLRPGKPIPYGTQIIVTDGLSEATLDFYPKRGRTVIGGSSSALRAKLEQMTAEPAPAPAAQKTTAPRVSPVQGAQAAHIGMDESGKGDWYGPLVVAAVYIRPEDVLPLRRAGVRDSKELDGSSLTRIAAKIEVLIPAEARKVLVLDPATYNRRYAGLENINLLLAELYAEAAVPVQEATGASSIICDQFAQRADRLERSFAAAHLPKPTQLHHAESASLAVAAASILASATFAAELLRLGKEAGLAYGLPAGASAISALRGAAQQIMQRFGREGMGNFAKLNFKPVQEILNQ